MFNDHKSSRIRNTKVFVEYGLDTSQTEGIIQQLIKITEEFTDEHSITHPRNLDDCFDFIIGFGMRTEQAQTANHNLV